MRFERVEVFALLSCLALIVFVFELVRRGKIKERYSLLWFCTAGCLLVLTLRRSWLETFAKTLGVYSPPNALFLVLILFLIAILIHYSMVLSDLLSQNQKLAQSVALLRNEIEKLQAKPPS